jgi:hypothetical protein
MQVILTGSGQLSSNRDTFGFAGLLRWLLNWYLYANQYSGK